MFKHRSYENEMLDAAIIPQQLLYRNLQELNTINQRLGGHAVTIRGLQTIITDKTKQYHVADIGCGGGDALTVMAAWGKAQGYRLTVTGVDLKEDCISYARQHCRLWPTINLLCADYKEVFSRPHKVDIVHAALFCHHFAEEELAQLVMLCRANGAVLIINDLERHPLAYYGIKVLTRLFSRSALVKNDAPLSVLRGFKKKEWIAILHMAGTKKYTIQNCRAFRHLIIVYPDE